MDKRVYLGGFDDWPDVQSNFEIDIPEPEFVWACYSGDGWEGYAVVIFNDGSGWKRTSGSHCSCYGLEGQFEPEDFSIEEYFLAIEKQKNIEPTYHAEGDASLREYLSQFRDIAA